MQSTDVFIGGGFAHVPMLGAPVRAGDRSTLIGAKLRLAAGKQKYVGRSRTHLLVTYDQPFPGKWIFDVAANYSVNRLKFTLGVDNLFNTYPSKVIAANNNGAFPYPGVSPFGYEGAYVYGKVQYRW